MVTYFCPETREQRNVLTVEKASASEVAPLTSGYIMPWMMAAQKGCGHAFAGDAAAGALGDGDDIVEVAADFGGLDRASGDRGVGKSFGTVLTARAALVSRTQLPVSRRSRQQPRETPQP